MANAKHNLEKRQALVKKRSVVLHATCQWEEVFSYKIQQIVAQNAAAKRLLFMFCCKIFACFQVIRKG